ncbi:aromatic acid decarboxylase [Gemmatimonas aurantiaca T-27]|uniref:Flavin prenyltransferase UbiX n=2 Tax=Gemmatimonas aurantiaca TaxID=173480 RepID=C1AB74_GEMAT|nr:flavin prenyltransferase UbiX [Gemmatimonas aurantiaca]BAH39480.1 aromatic acid decarboxylase [Gemmatimonas aurantiaca T-27]
MSSDLDRWMPRHPVVLAITGASGAPYAVRLLQALVALRVPTWLIVSGHGWRLLQTESEIGDLETLRVQVESGGTPGSFASVVTVFDDTDRGAPPASGSARTSGMVVCPCSMGTVSAIAHGTSRSLVERAADVALKERRKLILVPRETPLSLIHLENLTAVTRAGATVIPAAPGFYHKPAGISDLVDFMVARILDHLDIEHDVGRRWGSIPGE